MSRIRQQIINLAKEIIMGKKLAIGVTMALTAAMTLAGCSSSGSQSGSSAAAGDTAAAAAETSGETWTVSLSTPISETNIVADNIREFVSLVNERTDGRLTINPFYSNVLGSQKDMITSLANNEIELIMDGGITDYYATEYGYLFAPFLVRDADQMQAIMDSEIFDDMKAVLEEDNIAMIGSAIRGNRVVFSAQEITSADDINKLTIRMPDISTYITAWGELGASTQVMGGADVYSALSTGVVNSCEGPFNQGVSDKYAEVTDYLYPTNHITETYYIFASDEWLDSLPEDVAQVVRDTAEEVMDDVTETCAADAENSLQTLQDSGMTYVEGIDFEPLFEQLRPVYEQKFASGEWAGSYDDIMSYR